MTRQIEDLLGKRFIQRTDVKAMQKGEIYFPVTKNRKRDGERLPWTRDDLTAHLAGERSMGHYMVDLDGNCKLFAFDIDLRDQAKWVGIEEDGSWSDMEPRSLNPRSAWLHPEAPETLRRYLVSSLRNVAEHLSRLVVDILDIPTAISYSGNKGLHVYGFTGTAPAGDVRAAAQEIISYSGRFELFRGNNFYRPIDQDPKTGNPVVDIEVFPKQDDLHGKDLGNLMRLPLGVHGKSQQRSYFIDINTPIESLVEMDAVEALGGEQ